MANYTIEIGQTRNLVVAGDHDGSVAYNHPTLVTVGNATYATKEDVPTSTAITDSQYWDKLFEGGMNFRGDYDSAETYNSYDVVHEGNAVYIVNADTVVSANEDPATATSKWSKIFDGNSLTFAADSVLFTDASGSIQELALTAGNLQYDGSTLAFTPPVASNGGIKITALPKGISSCNLGINMLTTDDSIVSSGHYASNVYHNSSSLASQLFLLAKFENISHTGTWAGLKQGYHTLYAWTTTGELYSMGYNGYGQLGLGDTTLRHVLTKTAVADVVDVVVSGYNTAVNTVYALTSTGKVFVSGYNGYGQCAQGNTTTLNTFTEITGFGGGAVQVSVSDHQYAFVHIVTDEPSNNLYSAGYNGYGQLGTGNTTQQTSLVQISKTVTKALAMGNYSSYCHSIILLADGTVEGTGYNAQGQLGIGSTTQKNVYTPTADGFNGYVDIFGNESYSGSTFGLTSTGVLKSWGYNGYGQLGLGNNTNANTPTEPAGAFQGSVVTLSSAAGYNGNNTIIVTNDGEAYFSGYSGNYQRGTGIAGQATTFELMPTGSEQIVDSFITGTTTSTACYLLTSDGDVLVSGYNGHGQCAVGNTSSVSRTTKVIL